MTVGERILKFIESRGMKKVEFAKEVGIDQSYITKIASGDRQPSERLIEDICRKFRIRKEWLLDGEEPIYKETVKDVLDDESLTDLDKSIIRGYVNLKPELRAAIREWIEEIIKDRTTSKEPEPEAVPDDEKDRAAMHRILDEEYDEVGKRKTSSASTITNGLSSRANKT